MSGTQDIYRSGLESMQLSQGSQYPPSSAGLTAAMSLNPPTAPLTSQTMPLTSPTSQPSTDANQYKPQQNLLGGLPQPQQEIASAGFGSMNYITWIIIGIVALVLIIVVLMVYIMRKKTTNEEGIKKDEPKDPPRKSDYRDETPERGYRRRRPGAKDPSNDWQGDEDYCTSVYKPPPIRDTSRDVAKYERRSQDSLVTEIGRASCRERV